MGKFAISCPHCGNYMTAYNGIRGLVQNQIKCENCNNVVDVKNSRMTSIVCPNCNNSVMYDQGKKIPRCPVCQQEISPASGQKMISIHCPTCHTAYTMSEGTKEYTCPLCDSIIDVRKEVASMHANVGTTSLIEYDPGDKDWLVYKHPIKNFSNGSQLRVRPGQQALLIEEGEDSHLFEKGQYTMDTANFPWMERIYKLSDGDTRGSFQSSIYFFNLRIITNDIKGRPLEWFVKKTPVIFSMKLDETTRAKDVVFNIGCSGTYDLRIEDARKLFLNLNAAAPGLNVSMMENQSRSDSAGALFRAIKGKVSAWGGEILANTFKQLGIGIFELDAKRSMVARTIEEKVNDYLKEFGLAVSNLLVDSFATPEDDPDDPGYRPFIEIKTMASSAVVQQSAEIHEQDIERIRRNTQREKMATAREALGFDEIEAERKRIVSEAEARAQRLAGLTEAEIMRAKGYSQKDVLQAEVQKAYAEGIGNMGPVVSSGGSSVIGDMLGIGVGMAAASSIAPQINGMMNGFGEQHQIFSKSNDENGWECPNCGTRGNTLRFCPACGKEQPVQQPQNQWDCPVCGMKGNKAKFCPECGAKQPLKIMGTVWNCPGCGKREIVSKFCPECGMEKPKKDTWDCTCGETGISTKFCPSCGKPRDAQGISKDDSTMEGM